ncbi:hypothetical protein, partial [Klebsiella pneumoniae]|uniref:hypothetical protein n=1 Tax=Klebsiella pneumoniae TaxID=573 RepID=UPI0034E97B2E
YDQMRVFEFVTTILIPKILPENPNYLSPSIYEIFSKVSQAVEVNVDSANEYIKKLTDPVFFPFIIIYLINLDPSSIDLEYSCGVMLSALDTDKV